MRLKLGLAVIACCTTTFNGSKEQPAIINRLWSNDDTLNGPQTANMMVLPDCGVPFPMSSVLVHDTRPSTPIPGRDAWLARDD